MNTHLSKINGIISIFIGVFKLLLIYVISTYFGFILSLIISYCLLKLYKLSMKNIYNLEYLATEDLGFIGQTPNEKFTLVGIMMFDNTFSEKALREFCENMIKKLPKFRSKLEYKFFNYYWKEVSLEEAFKQVKTIQTPFSTEEDFLQDFIGKEVNNPIDIFEELPYELTIVHIGEDKGAIVLRMDHTMSDGIGMITALCCLADNYNINIFPKFLQGNNIPWYKYYIIDIVSSIFYFPQVLKKIELVNDKETPIRTLNNLSGFSKFAVSKSFSIKSFDKIKQELGISFNDLVLSAISKSIKEFCIQEDPIKYKDLSEILILIPIGTKVLPRSEKELKIKNQLNGIMCNLSIIDDIKSEAKSLSKKLQSSLRNTALNTTMYRLGHLVTEFSPLQQINKMARKITKNMDLIITNLPGPISPLFLNGCKISSMFAVPSTQNASGFIAIVSYNKEFKFVYSMTQDLNYNPQEIIDLIEKSLNELLE